MYIKITQEIVTRAIKNKDSEAYVILKMLDWCAYRGCHFIYGESGTLRELALHLRNDFPCLSTLWSKDSELAPLTATFEWHLEFGFSSSDEPFLSRKDEATHTIYVNADASFDAYRECHLLAENLHDICLFRHILDYYRRIHSSAAVPYAYYPILGGGSTTKDVYKHEMELGKSLVLCIVDSDKHYPKDHIGDTAEQVRREEQNAQSFNSYCYVMEKVLEVENLVPMHIYESYAQKHKELKDAYEAVNAIRMKDPTMLDFYDFKEGVTPSYLVDPNPDNNCRDVAIAARPDLDEIIKAKESEWQKMRKELDKMTCLKPQERDRIFKKCKKEDCYIPGFGKNILEHVIDEYDKELSAVKQEDLSETQKQEYEEIGKLLYNWTCALSPIRS